MLSSTVHARLNVLEGVGSALGATWWTVMPVPAQQTGLPGNCRVTGRQSKLFKKASVLVSSLGRRPV